MDIKRGREKTVASPDGEARKKKGSLFRRASLSRKKNKEEAKMRSKSKDRYAEHSQSTNTLSMPRNKAQRVTKIYKKPLWNSHNSGHEWQTCGRITWAISWEMKQFYIFLRRAPLYPWISWLNDGIQMTSVILLKRKKPNLHPYHVTSNHRSADPVQKPKTKILLEGELWILKILSI